MRDKPQLSFWQIWNMCFGFLGIQFGFALQNANVSRIFQTLGASMDTIPLLWIAAPLTGLLVQPIVGYYSDRTWHPVLGRRRPYFLVGALLASAALVFMPNSPTLWIAAGLLWVLDASINIAMEPFRAYVGDQLPPKQRPTGYAMQSFFIGVGAVVASALPWLLTQAGVANTAPEGQVPDSVRYAFYLGGAVLLGAIGWTILSTREYAPEQLAAFDADRPPEAEPDAARIASAQARGNIGVALGVALAAAVLVLGWDRQLYVLAGLVGIGGALFAALPGLKRDGMLRNILSDMLQMPEVMKQLALVQFFSWFALFAMWIYTTAGVAAHHYGSSDPTSREFNDAGDWVGVLFAAYNGFAIVAAMLIPLLVRSVGARATHIVMLLCGAAGFGSFLLIGDPRWLLASMVGVGFAWASILSLPYALLANSLPARKMGTYMGVFNFFIVIPQLVAASVLGLLLRYGFGSEPIYALLIGAISFVVAAACTLRVRLVA
ncbi:MAG: MFS transporter [Aquimonas sp.]|nr:MFS transporter [Aquimonas sp.]